VQEKRTWLQILLCTLATVPSSVLVFKPMPRSNILQIYRVSAQKQKAVEHPADRGRRDAHPLPTARANAAKDSGKASRLAIPERRIATAAAAALELMPSRRSRLRTRLMNSRYVNSRSTDPYKNSRSSDPYVPDELALVEAAGAVKVVELEE